MQLHRFFFNAADRYPDENALVFGESSRTYRQTAEQVLDLSEKLSKGLARGSRIVINRYKSGETILLMLACLRAGIAYIPMEPATPIARRRFIVEDSGAQAVACDERTIVHWQGDLPPVGRMIWPEALLEVDQVPVDPGRHSISSEDADGGDDDLAYILYTSGSTGQPKGVLITHQNASAFVSWATECFDLRPGDRVAVHAPLQFDLPVFDIYASLACGATVYPVPESVTLFPEALFRFLRDNEITVLYAVPSALTALVNRSSLAQSGLSRIRLLLYAGEEFHTRSLEQLMGCLPNARVFNLYGPIETNVITFQEVKPEHLLSSRIPIGRPLSNCQISLMGGGGELIDAVDEEGEIIVSGPCVSPGYLNSPDLTRASRIRVEDSSGGRNCYRTGDYARKDPSGTLHFLGRRDDRIKTRGFRVELGDTESVVMSHPQVAEAAVVALPHPAYTNLIYVFVIPRPGASIEPDSVLTWCQSRLPSYMIPHRVFLRTEFPRTITGKIAKRQLGEELRLAFSGSESDDAR